MTNSELVLLSLIAERPRHGYEIERLLEERGMREWTEIAFSSIYFLLNKLVRDGRAESATQPAQGRGPAKKVFSITQTGLDSLREGVRAGLSHAEPGGQTFMFGLSCQPLLTHAETLAALQTRRQALSDKRTQLAQHPALTRPGFPTHVIAMFTYSLALLESELNWLEKFMNDFTEE